MPYGISFFTPQPQSRLRTIAHLQKELFDTNIQYECSSSFLQRIISTYQSAQGFKQQKLNLHSVQKTNYIELTHLIHNKKIKLSELSQALIILKEKIGQKELDITQLEVATQQIKKVQKRCINTSYRLNERFTYDRQAKKALRYFAGQLKKALVTFFNESSYKVEFSSLVQEMARRLKEPNPLAHFYDIQKEVFKLCDRIRAALQQDRGLLFSYHNELSQLEQEYNLLEEQLDFDNHSAQANQDPLKMLEHEIQQVNYDLHRINFDYYHQKHLAGFLHDKRQQLLLQCQEEYQKVAVHTAINQQILNNLKPVIIQDIIITHLPEIQGSGEIDLDGTEPYLSRMIQQIKVFTQFAMEQHQNNMEDGVLKENYLNNITRIITDEFSFYPREPLSIESYQYLLQAIYNIAKKLPLNIQLILGTFPVFDNKGDLHNITVHVASGNPPVLHHHSKVIPSKLDFTYGNKLAHQNPYLIAPQMVFIDLEKPLVFGFGTVVHSITAGGTVFISNVEICKEHQLSTGMICLHNELDRAKLDKELFSLQYSHVVTSRRIGINSFHPSSVPIVQADAGHPGIWMMNKTLFQYYSVPPVQVTEIDNYFGQRKRAYVFSPKTIPYLPDPFFSQAAIHNESLAQQEASSSMQQACR